MLEAANVLPLYFIWPPTCFNWPSRWKGCISKQPFPPRSREIKAKLYITCLLQNKANKSTQPPFAWQRRARRDFQVNLLRILRPKQSYFLDKLSLPAQHRQLPSPPEPQSAALAGTQLQQRAEATHHRGDGEIGVHSTSPVGGRRDSPNARSGAIYQHQHSVFCVTPSVVLTAGTAAGYLWGFQSSTKHFSQITCICTCLSECAFTGTRTTTQTRVHLQECRDHAPIVRYTAKSFIIRDWDSSTASDSCKEL